MNADSAVALDRKREAQPFRSKVDGFPQTSSSGASMERSSSQRRSAKAQNEFEIL
jgi:hypothetical protein